MAETPPSNIGRSYMHFRRGDGEGDSLRSDILSKFGQKLYYNKKEVLPAMAERENINKVMGEIRKNIGYLENSRWMFSNNGDMNPLDHLTKDNL